MLYASATTRSAGSDRRAAAPPPTSASTLNPPSPRLACTLCVGLFLAAVRCAAARSGSVGPDDRHEGHGHQPNEQPLGRRLLARPDRLAACRRGLGMPVPSDNKNQRVIQQARAQRNTKVQCTSHGARQVTESWGGVVQWSQKYCSRATIATQSKHRAA